MKRHIFSVVSVFIVIAMLSGCQDQNTFEDIGFALSIGFDLSSNDGKTVYTMVFPNISDSGGSYSDKGDGSADYKVDIFSEETYLVREARDLGRLSSTKHVEGGKIQNVLFSSDLAQERKLSEYLEIFERDTRSTVQSTVIVVDGSARELLEKGSQFTEKPRISLYLADLLERNFKSGYCPDTNIVRYDILNVRPGISPIVPLIRLENDKIRVLGSALIDRDKMTGRLDTRETACLFLAMGKNKGSEITFALPEGVETQKKEGIIFTRKVKSKQSIRLENNTPVVSFDIRLSATLDEYTWGDITQQEFESRMEQSLSSSITATLNEVFKKLQEADCDVFGFGDKIHAYHNSYWKSIGGLEGWKTIYPTVKINVNLKADLIRYGEIK
ncbi:Spore germination B3/ GerAC like, C-terminal [Sporobacter termitidis DSM 10068]|uniref:Spore germination B3/ GerAC like, C-terminal n=1 Tax=Sporobacter termitidis DSM 10068 TaxID=1123282 RepID=A0A1M5YM61_9FIRM|nr:Ger(x)C family spore germination protein [Sporobacter termitidis]SHI12989.1 Spore germination B3/ GerAC like, C-terminal [Sporobacter termitidis DSM 10068]